MGGEPRIGPTESSCMMDAEQRLPGSVRSDRQKSLEVRPRWTALGKPFAKPLNRRRFEQAADRNLHIQHRTDAADHTQRQQRMAPKLEEVVVDPNPPYPQNLGKQTAQHLL